MVFVWQMLNQSVLAALPHDAHPMGMLVGSICALSSFHPDANPALSVHFEFYLVNGTSLKPYYMFCHFCLLNFMLRVPFQLDIVSIR